MEDDLMAWAPATGAASAPEVVLPGYSGFRVIAQGGEGTIYRARQDGLGRDVAVKVLQVTDPATLTRFRRELAITVELGRQHPHIVTVLDTGTLPDGRPCIVMEFYERGSLHDRLRAMGPLPVPDVVAAGIAVADALAFAHGQGILHRDVKPQNVLVLPTSYVLADFGIARGADAGHSASLQMVSYRHAAPQMLEGATPSFADDIWSLGSTLFTLLEGKPPFASDNPDEDTLLSYVGRVSSGEPRPLTRFDVPPWLATVINRCLRKDRADRFGSALELRDALMAANSGNSLSSVDPDATAMLGERVYDILDGPTEAPGFGPRGFVPEPEPEPAPQEEPDDSWRGQLADLTYRQHDLVPQPPRPQPVAVLPIVDLPPAEPMTAPVRKRKRGGLLAVLAVVAVTGGIVAGMVLNRPDNQRSQPPVTTTSPETTTTLPAPTSDSADAGPLPNTDPKFVPVLKRAEYQGKAIELEWSDPSDGQAEFVVIDVTGAKPVAVTRVTGGSTTYVVEDGGGQRRCYQIAAFGYNGERGSSAKVCANKN
ncbi:serine/threonine-protein kinase [Lentzea sp. BCCO 10_0856]|uniref:non-specific serine/threonine protein kinase n=1 Tax=Lentzea miocenica TaxID=3095431 RepID=A0ABU4SXR9_9PSEU|nr:serine/threonine-protein kinase [Lentzea sp. BCCO 10_0856]MDX8030710.1 serine/threonine-protein kinase [Lentzea sp. BCCO 10_0856]